MTAASLDSKQRLVLTLDFGPRLRLESLSWCRGEILTLDSSGVTIDLWRFLLLNRWADGATTGVCNQLMCLSGVLTKSTLCSLGGLSSVMTSELLDLISLLVDDSGEGLEVLVDELLVGLVDQGGEEEDGGGDDSKAPVWNDLDEVVGEESTEKCLLQISILARRKWGKVG